MRKYILLIFFTVTTMLVYSQQKSASCDSLRREYQQLTLESLAMLNQLEVLLDKKDGYVADILELTKHTYGEFSIQLAMMESTLVTLRGQVKALQRDQRGRRRRAFWQKAGLTLLGVATGILIAP